MTQEILKLCRTEAQAATNNAIPKSWNKEKWDARYRYEVMRRYINRISRISYDEITDPPKERD